MLSDQSKKNEILEDFRRTYNNNNDGNNIIGNADNTEILVITWLRMRSSGRNGFTVRKPSIL